MNISQAFTEDLQEVAQRYGIQLILQFGSTVGGPVHSRSDLDLAILLNNADVSLERFGDIQQSLQSYFPGREVDLALINRADPLFIKKIIERCRLLYGSAKDLQRLRLYAFKLYQDHRRFLDLERRYVERNTESAGDGAMIDRELVTRKLMLILQDLSALTGLARKSQAEYLSDPIHQVLAERYLERTIGRMIDVNYHLITESGHAPPKDYYESFVSLGTLKILPIEFARALASAAGLRNRIVHEYDEIDAVKLHEALQTAIEQMPIYIDAVRQSLPPPGPNRDDEKR